MPTEVEAKLRADGPEPLERLAAIPTLGQAELGPATTVEEIDTYLDTADGAFATARWACRLRARNAVVTISLKGAADGPESGGIHRRPEVEAPATASRDPADWPPSPARDLVDRLRGGNELVERLTLRQLRTERAVTMGAATIGTLSLDAVTVRVGDEERGRFHVVELELAADTVDIADGEGGEGGEGGLAELAQALAARRGLVPDRLTKLERALELIGEL
jgi:inorganic triphosphatase YgiF